MEDLIYTNEYEATSENSEVAIYNEEPNKEKGIGKYVAGAGLLGLAVWGGISLYRKVTGKADQRKIKALEKKGYVVCRAANEESEIEVEIDEK